MNDIYLDERESKQVFNAMKQLNNLIEEIMLENKIYKKENERLEKYEKWYLEHRRNMDKD